MLLLWPRFQGNLYGRYLENSSFQPPPTGSTPYSTAPFLRLALLIAYQYGQSSYLFLCLLQSPPPPRLITLVPVLSQFTGKPQLFGMGAPRAPSDCAEACAEKQTARLKKKRRRKKELWASINYLYHARPLLLQTKVVNHAQSHAKCNLDHALAGNVELHY